MVEEINGATVLIDRPLEGKLHDCWPDPPQAPRRAFGSRLRGHWAPLPMSAIPAPPPAPR